MSSNKVLRIFALLMIAVLLSSFASAGNGKAKGQVIALGSNGNKDKTEAQDQGNSGQGDMYEITILPNKDKGNDKEDKNKDDKGNSNHDIGPVSSGDNNGNSGSNTQDEKVKVPPENAIMPLLPPPAASNPHQDNGERVIIIPIEDQPKPAPCPISNPVPHEEIKKTIGPGNSILPVIPPGNSIQPVSPPVEEQRSGGFAPVHDQIPAPVDKEKASDNEITLPPPSKTEVKKIREVLKLTNDEKISDDTVQKLIKRQSEDSASFQEITNTTNELVDDSVEKQLFVDEVVSMNKNFVSKFSEAVKEQRPTIKKQVKEYIKTVKEQTPAKVELKSEQIQNLFSGKLDIDSLMEQLWNS